MLAKFINQNAASVHINRTIPLICKCFIHDSVIIVWLIQSYNFQEDRLYPERHQTRVIHTVIMLSV